MTVVSDSAETPKSMIIREMCGDGKRVRDLTPSAITNKAIDGHNRRLFKLNFESSIHSHGSKF